MRRAVAPLAVSFALALVPAARADDAAEFSFHRAKRIEPGHEA